MRKGLYSTQRAERSHPDAHGRETTRLPVSHVREEVFRLVQFGSASQNSYGQEAVHLHTQRLLEDVSPLLSRFYLTYT